MQTFEILGKKYQIQSSLDAGEADKINGEIESRLRGLISEYPALDKIDILVLYVIELKKKISGMERNYSREAGKLEKAKNKVAILEKTITEKLKNLDKS